MKKRQISIVLVTTALIVGASIQFIRPQIPTKKITGDLQAPREVKDILRRACYDCHSNQTQLRWFDQIAPIYWRVADHVKDGRDGLNFSEWDKLSAAEQKAKLWEAVNQISANAMPLKDYQLVHPESKISSPELSVLKAYMTTLIKTGPSDSTTIEASIKQRATIKAKKASDKLPVTLNGHLYSRLQELGCCQHHRADGQRHFKGNLW